MSDAIAALSDALRNDAETLRVIGQNVANIETVAYRREIAVMRPSFDQASDDARASMARAAAARDRDRSAARQRSRAPAKRCTWRSKARASSWSTRRRARH